MDIDNYSQELAKAISSYLIDHQEFFSKYEILAFDVGCFPWHGCFELSFLTSSDKLEDKYDIANWKLYAFNHELLPPSPYLDRLGQEMLENYSSSDERSDLTLRLLCATAKAAMSTLVRGSIGQYNLHDNFKVTVFDPDASDQENFCLAHS
ncbi:hypothetical protein [Thaumasiovibrio subtropicus]|uniref:hypothetical protein n=1 Tax=Thaumasiovibrio subtropicus TaxID=1891207 RepID=UPI000B352466|nr:hypothetical protein [Thaumasiovibrio subtropicus]